MWIRKCYMKVISIHNFISSSGSGTVINYGSGSGSDFLTSYGSGSGSGSTSQKVTVPVPVLVPPHCYLAWTWYRVASPPNPPCQFNKNLFLLKLKTTWLSICAIFSSAADATCLVWWSGSGLPASHPQPSSAHSLIRPPPTSPPAVIITSLFFHFKIAHKLITED
jgi:hypothetical protein